MNGTGDGNEVTRHWVGLDVSKNTFDVGLVLNGRLGEMPALRTMPTKAFARTPRGVAAFVAWIDERCEEVEGPLRCVMETTGRYSTELALWLLEKRASLAPAIVHAKHASDFIKSLGVRNHTDSLAARALALLGLQRQPKAYEPASKQERILREECQIEGKKAFAKGTYVALPVAAE
jgi:transposase